eukprot:CAMPEP_0171682650 /NCGR_PEP_ID=MMETSP0991-20121206/657_1 /TAXON_ID=483369 /ORGANISM="non described non described, Strain CCMP2098" /LENGTH=182 /DNA_ID=CAMNT_0012269903 /DNA_START=57 /DNA_END=605 /DNA_ORIENTATION=-
MSESVCLPGRIVAGTLSSCLGGWLMGFANLSFAGKVGGTTLGVMMSMYPDAIPSCENTTVCASSAIIGTILGATVLPGGDIFLQSLLGSTTCATLATVHASGRALWQMWQNIDDTDGQENNEYLDINGNVTKTSMVTWMKRDQQRARTSREMLRGNDVENGSHGPIDNGDKGLYSWLFGIPW